MDRVDRCIMDVSCVNVETWVVEYIRDLGTDIIYTWAALTYGPVICVRDPPAFGDNRVLRHGLYTFSLLKRVWCYEYMFCTVTSTTQKIIDVDKLRWRANK